MTDSMKFGPEWLRNMSADNTSFLSSGGNTGGGPSLSNSGTVINTSTNSNNGGNGSGHHSFGISSNVPTPTINQFSFALASRNIFPEFRYGREEMLSLFDKKYDMPEILPTFKKIFVDKVQLPLALTPSTDEELLPQVPPVPTQRSSWMQRSPVGFSSSTRGTGRGGSVDRGRMRGKSSYQIYQRPTALFGDEDSRSVPLKVDRGWPERNGAGDSLNIGGINLSADWNGTPASSPRKEFSSHPRNMENWRRNRHEDGSGDASTSGLCNTEGWRGSICNGGSFTGTHRWGRSTSWRDDDITSASPSEVGYGSGGGSGITMQRSYSTITTVNERGGYIGSSSSSSLTKTPPNAYSSSSIQASSRTFNPISGLNIPSARSVQWNANSGGGDGEDNLPEWAMENPSDGGGTFDASGAFHRSVDEDESEISEKHCRKKSNSSSGSSARINEISLAEDNKSSETLNGRTTTSLENDHNKSSASDSEQYTEENSIVSYNGNASDSLVAPISNSDTKSVHSQNTIVEELGSANLNTSKRQQGNTSDTTIKDVAPKEAVTLLAPYFNSGCNSLSKPNTTTNDCCRNVHRDISDRMREVADDMIEKLIMDDDTISISDNNGRNDIKSESSIPSTQATATTPVPTGNNLCPPDVFTAVSAILKKSPHQSLQVSPPLTSITDGGGVHKGIPLYGGGLVIDHATMQHHHLQQQQQQLAAANLTSSGGLPQSLNSATSTAAPTDLWYYRDPQTKVQGPFTAIEMTEWYRAGYFNENLFVRRLCDTHFRSLGDLIKLCNDNMPFTHSHLIPNLDNMHLSNSATTVQKSQVIGDYVLKQPTLQQNEQNDQLKNNSGVNFLGGNVKNLIPVDVSNMYFQMLRHQEVLIYNELSENECFQQLTPSEKEAIVRQKLQIHSEYLSSLSGLGSSIASINHTAALYDVMMSRSKKDIFSGPSNTGSASVPHQSQQNPFLEPEGFIINSQQHQLPIQTVLSSSPFGNVLPPGGENTVAGKLGQVNEDQTGNGLLNNSNMRMFLPSGNGNLPLIPNPKAENFIGGPNVDFVNDAQLLVNRSSLAQNHSLVHSWVPSLPNRATIAPPQRPNEWANNIPVGMPMAAVQGCNSSTANVNNLSQEIQRKQAPQQPQKAIPTSMWDLPTLDHAPSEQTKQQQQIESNTVNLENHQSLNIPPTATKDGKLKKNCEVNIQPKRSDITATVKQHNTIIQNQQQNSPITVLPGTSNISRQRKEETNDKYQNGNTKRIVKQTPTSNKTSKGYDESTASKKQEEERRRDQAEDRRRQKEEKKRQQADEEKRRQQQVEEEKRRQMLEDSERQQQIQAQRRKALMGNNSNANISSTALDGTLTSGSKPTKEQRVQSSIAPWSAQTNAAAAKGGPCLAEIQKAERRERQMEQRQMDMIVKRVRASAAAAAEAFDSMLKWNAPTNDVPVKSFAEIQAEEAKLLANEQTEIQRRKEYEQQQAAAAICATSKVGFGSNKISAIWSGTKVWGSTCTTGFWEEPIKFSAAVAANNNSNTAAGVGTSPSSTNNQTSKQTITGQQKFSVSSACASISTTSGQNTNQQQNSATRNLRKSQTVPVMQNTAVPNGNGSKSNPQQLGNIVKPGSSNKVQQKAGGNGDGGTGFEKRGTSKNQLNNYSFGGSISYSKRDDYENEFIAWCTKSLNNMNTKLDVPTFVTFLRDLESPYEVKDYIRMYLGENKESAEFGKQFLERRSKYKNLQRAQNAHNDDMCKPAPAITPSGNENFDNKGKQKKVKKNKMTKLDARILGFSVTAAEGRTNVGDRVYLDAP